MNPLDGDTLSSTLNGTDKVHTVAGISIVTSFLSFICSGSVLVCSIYHRRVFYPEIFPTFHLAAADFLASLFVIASSVIYLIDVSFRNGSGVVCNIISGLVTSFYTTAFLMTVVYALEALFRFRKKLINDTRLSLLLVETVSSQWMYLVYALAWLAPQIVTVFMIVQMDGLEFGTCSMCFVDFRFDEKSCWSEDEHGYLRHMVKLVFMVPLVLVVLINMILYMLIWQTYKKVVVTRGLLSCHQKQEEEILRRKTCLYQTVFFVCWLPSIVLGCASFSDDYTTSKFYPGFILQVFLGPLQGVLNSIVYGWQRRSFRRALTETSSLLSSNRTSIMSISL